MSSAKSPSAKAPPAKESATLQTTRQMLDELDALMDRMLALPVNDVDDPVPTPREIVRIPTVAATLTVVPPVTEAEEAEEPATEPSEPLLRESFPSYRVNIPSRAPSEPDADSPRQAHPAFQPPHFEAPEFEPVDLQPPEPSAASIDPNPFPEEVITPTVTNFALAKPEPEPDSAQWRAPRRSLVGMLLLPVTWFNQAFDTATLILGPPGRLLRGPRGRHLLGLTGLSLAAAAGLWLMKDWLGWTW